MSDYPKGLRFDIYERFTLSDEVAGISELEDIELTPRITMQTQEDQALLSGDLLLTGTYVGVGEQAGTKQLSHQIPVEITLPLKRIKRMDHIGIEIENFDVELLSDRSLNITGVISLNGIDTSAEQAWQQQGEALFVHEADGEASDSASVPIRAEEQEAAAAGEGSEHPTQAGAANREAATDQLEATDRVATTDQAEAADQVDTAYRYDATDQADASDAGDSESAQEIAHAAPDYHDQQVQEQIDDTAPIYNLRPLELGNDATVSVRSSDQSEALSFSDMLTTERSDGNELLNLQYNQEEQRVEPLQVETEKQEPDISSKATQEPVGKQSVVETKEQSVSQENQQLGTSSNEPLDGKTLEPASDNELLKANAEPMLEQAHVHANELIEQEEAEANESLVELKAQNESKEMKIAFGSNKQETDEWSGAATGVKSLLQHAADQSEQQEQQREEEATAEEEHQKDAKSLEESVRWKNLLLSAEQEEQRFSKMRMCIVQKEETLEGIAMRYSLNPKEIVLYNRLESEQVHEGQVIYIPR